MLVPIWTSGCFFRLLNFATSVFREVRLLWLVLVVGHVGRGQHELGGGPVAGNGGDVPEGGYAQQGLDVRVVGGLRFERVPEEYQQVDFTLSNLGADLLVAPPKGPLSRQLRSVRPRLSLSSRPVVPVAYKRNGGARRVRFSFAQSTSSFFLLSCATRATDFTAMLRPLICEVPSKGGAECFINAWPGK